MPLKKDEHVKDLHKEISNSFFTFQKSIQQISGMPSVASAVSGASAKATEKRTLMHIAMDDLMDAFEDTVAAVISNGLGNAQDNGDDDASYEDLTGITIPYEIYKGLLEKREGMAVPIKEARETLNEVIEQRIEHPSIIESAEPSFLTLIKESLPIEQAVQVANMWGQVVSNIGKMFSEEEAIVADKTIKGLTNAFSQSFNEWLDENDENGMGDEAGAFNDELTAMGVAPALAQMLSIFGEDITEKAFYDETSLGTEGRKEEIKNAMIALITKDSPHALLVGNNGVGKAEITKAIATQIVEGDVPEELEGARVIKLKLTDLQTKSGQGQKADPLTGQPMHVNLFSERLHDIIQGVADHNEQHQQQLILNIDEFDDMFGKILPDLSRSSNILRSALTENSHARIIGEISEKTARILKKESSSLYREFSEVKVESLAKEYTVEKLGIIARTENEGLTIDPAFAEKIYDITKKHRTDFAQPQASIDSLRSAIATAKVEGAKELTLDHITDVISKATDLPVDILTSSMQDQIEVLREELPKRVLNQPDLVKIIDKLEGSTIGLVSRSSKVKNKKQPLGAFLLAGKSGTGKTFSGTTIGEILKMPVHRIDMSNYMEKHTVASLIGSPPGYVGFDGEAKLATTVGKTPYSVLILDEIEKAHPNFYKVLLPALEEGEMQLADGVTTIDLSNTIILMTSNVGVSQVLDAEKNSENSLGFGNDKDEDGIEQDSKGVMLKAIEKEFPPEFIGRLRDGILFFKELNAETVQRIALKEVEKTSKALTEFNSNLTLEISDKALSQLVEVGFSTRYGARPMEEMARNLIDTPMARWFDKEGKDITAPSIVTIKGLKEEFNVETKPVAANQNKRKTPAKKKSNGTNGPKP